MVIIASSLINKVTYTPSVVPDLSPNVKRARKGNWTELKVCLLASSHK